VVFIAIENSKGEFLGIIPHKAIFDELTEMLGFKNGKKITVYLYDIPGQLAKITRIFAKHNANIQNLVVRNPRTKFQIKEIILRVDESVSQDIIDDIEKMGYRVEL
jgi:ACT domain.